MKGKIKEKSLNGKGVAELKEIPRIIFNPDTVPQVEESKLNKYGLDLTNPDHIIFQREGLEAEVIGGVNTLVLNKFNVMLKISRRPSLNATEVYRNNVDLYSENNLDYFVKQTSIRLKVDSTKVADFIYDLIERLEQYRKDRNTYKEESIIIDAPQPKESTRVKSILRSETVVEEVQQLMVNAGILCPKISMQLLLIALSSKQDKPLHALLQGSPEFTSEIIQRFSKVLPDEVSRYKTSMSDNVLYYTPNKNHWNHKVLQLPTVDKLGKKNTALMELISQGYVSRMVTENTEKGNYRASNKSVNGKLSFISSTIKNHHELLDLESVIGLPLHNTDAIKRELLDAEIMQHAGMIDEVKVEKAKRLLQFLFRELKAVKVINPYLDVLDVKTFFDTDYKLITQFLRITNLVTLLHQKQLGMTKDGNRLVVEVQPNHMQIALELFQDIWFKTEKDLSFKVSGTLMGIKDVISKAFPNGNKNYEFNVKDMRKSLRAVPSTFAKHINTLYDYNKLERTGGTKNTGFTYKVVSWNDGDSSVKRFQELIKTINSL
jgi:hypothetical protein